MKLFKKKKSKIKNMKRNLKTFIKEEKREVKELFSGQQGFRRYCRDSFVLFKDYFIPGDHNNNRPRILRPKQLLGIAILLILFKVFVASYIFVVYQREAEMSEDIINQVFVLVNEERSKNELNSLNFNNALNESALAKGNDMITNNYFSHTSLDGRKPWDFVDRNKYQYVLIGENLAMNFITASGAHLALMASPSHQKNILNSKYTDIGLAVVNGEINGKNTNILIQLFGARTSTDVQVNKVEAQKDTSVKENVVSSDSLINNINNNLNNDSDKVVVRSEPDKVVSEKLDVKEINKNIGGEVDFESTDNFDTNEQLQPYNFELFGSEIADDLNMNITNSWEDFDQIEQIEEVPVPITSVNDSKINKTYKFIQISKIIYIVCLIILIIALIINIFVRITVQHKSVIIQALLLIVLIIALLLLDFSFIEKIREAVKNIIVL